MAENGTTRAVIIAIVVSALLAVLSGCSMDWASMSPELPSGSASTTETQSSSPAPTRARPAPADATPESDLASGSVTHTVKASRLVATIDYWTDQSPQKWAGQPAEVMFAVHVHYAPTPAKQVKATRVRVVADGDTELLSDEGEFQLGSDYSYGSGFVTPETTKTTTTVRLQVDLLVETSPGSGEFFRQTIFDDLHIGFAQKKA